MVHSFVKTYENVLKVKVFKNDLEMYLAQYTTTIMPQQVSGS